MRSKQNNRRISFLTYDQFCEESTVLSVENVQLLGTDRTFVDFQNNASSYTPKNTDGCAGTVNLRNVLFDATDRLCDNINAEVRFGKGQVGEEEAHYKLHFSIENFVFNCAKALYPSEYGSTAICFWGNVDGKIKDCVFEDCQVGVSHCYANYWWNVDLYDDVKLQNVTFKNCEAGVQYDDFDEQDLTKAIEQDVKFDATVDDPILVVYYDEGCAPGWTGENQPDGWVKDPVMKSEGGDDWYERTKATANTRGTPVTLFLYQYI